MLLAHQPAMLVFAITRVMVTIVIIVVAESYSSEGK
jgi:hypothetical protein